MARTARERARGLTQHDDEPELRIAPLIDTVFLLLIFFLVTAEAPTRETTLRLKIRRAEGEAAAAGRELLVVRLDAECGMEVGGRKVGMREFRAIVESRLRRDGPSLEVAVAGGAGTSAECLVRVLDVCGELGVSRFGLSRPGGG
jgi:biopolymer transport protein ExbD